MGNPRSTIVYLISKLNQIGWDLYNIYRFSLIKVWSLAACPTLHKFCLWFFLVKHWFIMLQFGVLPAACLALAMHLWPCAMRKRQGHQRQTLRTRGSSHPFRVKTGANPSCLAPIYSSSSHLLKSAITDKVRAMPSSLIFPSSFHFPLTNPLKISLSNWFCCRRITWIWHLVRSILTKLGRAYLLNTYLHGGCLREMAGSKP